MRVKEGDRDRDGESKGRGGEMCTAINQTLIVTKKNLTTSYPSAYEELYENVDFTPGT